MSAPAKGITHIVIIAKSEIEEMPNGELKVRISEPLVTPNSIIARMDPDSFKGQVTQDLIHTILTHTILSEAFRLTKAPENVMAERMTAEEETPPPGKAN